MPDLRRRFVQIALTVLAVGTGFCLMSLSPAWPRLSRAESQGPSADLAARSVTMFAIVATPGNKSVDSRLSTIKTQLDKLIPGQEFKLLDVQSKQLAAGEAIICDLRNGYKTQVSLVGSLDENGKLPLRCELFHKETRVFSTLVKSPLNQLFFCERELGDGSRLLIGVGAR